MFKKDDLPVPFFPITPIRSPFWNTYSNPSRIFKSPNDFFIFSALTYVSAQNDKKIIEKNNKSLKQFGRSIQIPENEIDPNGIIRCYSNQNEALLKAKYPNRKSTQEFEDWLAPKIQEVKRLKRLGRMPSVISIPVVVHVIHNGDAVGTNENIRLDQVLSQIQVFNEDFRKISGTLKIYQLFLLPEKPLISL